MIVKSVSELRTQEIAECQQLSRGRKGQMARDVLLQEQGWVFLIKPKTLLAWALVFPNQAETGYDVHVFVDSKHRRKGYGTQLLEAIKQSFSPLHAHPFDDQSKRFYENFDLILGDRLSEEEIHQALVRCQKMNKQ